MKLHRFYVDDQVLEHSFWLRNEALYHQWTKVLRFEVGREVALFNDRQEEKLYKIAVFEDGGVRLELVTEMEPKTPKKDVYLCFSLLKKGKNEWVLQKGTELGVRHFVPIITDRTEKTGFDIERVEKIIVEAAEQCGRADIPKVREPLKLETLLEELSDKVNIYVAQDDGQDVEKDSNEPIAVLVGPEGGWSDREKQLFADKKLNHLGLGPFTLRAETACVAAAVQLAG